MRVFGGEIKLMASWVNEGRFTRNNEGRSCFSVADVYLKGSVNTVSELKALSADIHIHCNRLPHMRAVYLLHQF